MLNQCKCKHKSQDELNGQQVRVHNVTAKKVADGKQVIRCTVCGDEKQVNK